MLTRPALHVRNHFAEYPIPDRTVSPYLFPAVDQQTLARRY
jgi:hypothetical protein